MRRALALAFVLGLLALPSSAGAIALQQVGGTFDNPVFMAAPPGDPRLFVVERTGQIQVLHDGVTSEFLDIHTLVDANLATERGLLSMAFDPNYATNGLFYVFFTDNGTAGASDGDNHVDEFHVNPADPNDADEGSRRRVLTLVRGTSASFHNGGQLQFGKDGLLYISVGDAANGANAPDLGSPHGKILRIDPHGAGDGDHGIPADNPYAGVLDDVPEIWSSGLRNPFRFSIDHLTGDLVIGDVGQSHWEEVDLAPASSGLGRATNWGWPTCEGFNAQGSDTTPCSMSGATAPVFAYPHDDPGDGSAFGCAIIGGYVYRGTQVPELAGRYLYADLCTGELRSVQLGLPVATGDRAESGEFAINPNSFGEDSSCELYVTNGSEVEKVVGSTPPTAAPGCVTAAPSTPATPKAKKCKKKKRKKHHRAAEAKKHKKKHCKKKKRKKKK
jgi:glucose/arabinose dehydrogenase